MRRFADRTGLTSSRPPRRYLWTDAFAVCNFLGLYRARGEETDLELARKLIEQVHLILGRHRPDDGRPGWISGLEEEKGAGHPTAGGLRIGKERPERGPDEEFEPEAEWDRDGQYFHYLTRWMYALNRAGRFTGEPDYHRWAEELAQAAFRGFTVRAPEGFILRMYWKMSIDLSRPLVASMGRHDPLDGLLTFCQIRADGAAGGLDRPIGELSEFCRRLEWTTVDPLGLGGLLTDVVRAVRLKEADFLPLPDLPVELIRSVGPGLEQYRLSRPERFPASSRLAFRELGLVIGIEAAVSLLESQAESEIAPELQAGLAKIKSYGPWKEELLSFWTDPDNQKSAPWREHRDINEVMLATALSPRGYI